MKIKEKVIELKNKTKNWCKEHENDLRVMEGMAFGVLAAVGGSILLDKVIYGDHPRLKVRGQINKNDPTKVGLDFYRHNRFGKIDKNACFETVWTVKPEDEDCFGLAVANWILDNNKMPLIEAENKTE